MNTNQVTFGEMLPSYIILAVFIAFCIFITVKAIEGRKAYKKKMAELKANGMTVRGFFTHINGLDLPQNASCEVLSYNDRYEFISGALKFNLLKNKVVDVVITTDTEIQNQYVSSVGGAVAGGLMFGPIGALIGGRAKEKQIKTDYSYLIFTYKNGDELKYIGFDVTGVVATAQKFVKEHKKYYMKTTNIEL